MKPLRSDLNLLTTYWEHPACVRCAGCGEPLEVTWSSSAVGHALYHGACHEEAMSCRV